MHGDYNHHWNGTRVYNKSSLENMMWRYREAHETKAMLIQGELAIYLGGGYSVEFYPKQDNHAIIQHMLEDHWLNRGTRAILITWSVFNAPTMYFSSVTLLMEFPESAGVTLRHSISTFKTVHYAKYNKFYLTVAEFIAFILLLHFTFRELKEMYQQKFKYFLSFWNLIEIMMVSSALASVVLHFYRSVIEQRILKEIADKKPDDTVDFGEIGFWGYGYTQAIACLNFSATIRLVKLLRLNRRTSLLETTLARARSELYHYSVAFGIVMAGFIIFATMIFRTDIYEYRKLTSATAAVIRLLLGKYSFREYQRANPVLGPFFFLLFNIYVNWIMINMLISILDDASCNVKREKVDLKTEESEAISMFFSQVKGTPILYSFRFRAISSYFSI